MKCSSFSPQHLSSRQSVQQSTSQVSGSPASGEAPGEDAPGSSLVRCSSSQEPACEQTVQAPLLCALHAAQLQERRLRGWGDQSARKPKCHLGWSLLPPPRVSQCIRSGPDPQEMTGEWFPGELRCVGPGGDCAHA